MWPYENFSNIDSVIVEPIAGLILHFVIQAPNFAHMFSIDLKFYDGWTRGPKMGFRSLKVHIFIKFDFFNIILRILDDFKRFR